MAQGGESFWTIRISMLVCMGRVSELRRIKSNRDTYGKDVENWLGACSMREDGSTDPRHEDEPVFGTQDVQQPPSRVQAESDSSKLLKQHAVTMAMMEHCLVRVSSMPGIAVRQAMVPLQCVLFRSDFWSLSLVVGWPRQARINVTDLSDPPRALVSSVHSPPDWSLCMLTWHTCLPGPNKTGVEVSGEV